MTIFLVFYFNIIKIDLHIDITSYNLFSEDCWKMEKTDKVKAPYHFIYNGIEYDATDYAEKHPGGLDFIENMKA